MREARTPPTHRSPSSCTPGNLAEASGFAPGALVPFVMETYGRLGQEALGFVRDLAAAAEQNRSRGADRVRAGFRGQFVRGLLERLSTTLQYYNAETVLSIARSRVPASSALSA